MPWFHMRHKSQEAPQALQSNLRQNQKMTFNARPTSDRRVGQLATSDTLQEPETGAENYVKHKIIIKKMKNLS